MVIRPGHGRGRVPVRLRHLAAGGQIAVGTGAQAGWIHAGGGQRTRGGVEIRGGLVQITVVHVGGVQKILMSPRSFQLKSREFFSSSAARPEC